MTRSLVMTGAEPASFAGGEVGVLVLHGFTGCPQSLRHLAETFAAAGITVELPLLPGHGTSVEDMVPTRWDDWAAAAESSYTELASRCTRVFVAGLSMGATLACWLASRHPEIAGLVAVNPMVEPPAEVFRDMLRGALDAGVEVAPGVGSDIARPGVTELAYDVSPVEAALSLFEGIDELMPRLGDIRCPVLLLTSEEDHVVAPVSSELLARRVGGPIRRVRLERSYHVATLDWDAGKIEAEAVSFVGDGVASVSTLEQS
jgi:carboxylesterase